MRILCVLLLFLLVSGLPLSVVAPLQGTDGETISVLDVCNRHGESSPSMSTTIAEPVFELCTYRPSVQVFERAAHSEGRVHIPAIDKPPTV